MNIAKHTPGPWTLKQLASGNLFVYGKGGREEAICGIRVLDNIETKDVGIANATLIAAAPDLINALMVLVNVCEARGIPCDAASAAIAKALGKDDKEEI